MKFSILWLNILVFILVLEMATFDDTTKTKRKVT